MRTAAAEGRRRRQPSAPPTVFSTVRRRAPRELVFWATVGLGLCALAAVLTGDLLSWDQNGYAATKTRTGFLTFLPWVGEDLLKIAIGGPGPALGQSAAQNRPRLDPADRRGSQQ